jgi:hypothetical protein
MYSSVQRAVCRAVARCVSTSKAPFLSRAASAAHHAPLHAVAPVKRCNAVVTCCNQHTPLAGVYPSETGSQGVVTEGVTEGTEGVRY